MLHAVQISFFSDPQQRPPAQLLQAWPTLVDVAEAASRSGIRVSVVQASVRAEILTRNGVHYHFLPFGRNEPPDNAKSLAFRELLRRLSPDVFHVQGLGFPRQVLSLAALAPGIPILLQDHADRPPRIWHRTLWRRGMSVAAGITFCALEQARPFESAGLVNPSTRLYQIPESSSHFTPGDKGYARRATRVSGAPLVLWVGHLSKNKDPLSVLEGISRAAHALPDLKLWCCFGTAPLLDQVRNRIRKDRMLRDRVHLLGSVPHERVEHLMRAADVFVLGSHRESTGYALIEAMACGLPPVVTDIPSFRSLMGDGKIGQLWPCNDPRALCDALRSVAARADSTMRAAVREHFERELSFDSLGARLATLYNEMLGCSHGYRDVGGWIPDGPVVRMT